MDRTHEAWGLKVMGVNVDEADAEAAVIKETARKADALGESGKPAGARDRLAALRLKAEQVFGLEHRETFIIRNRLAYWTGMAGDPTGARDQARVLLSEIEGVLGVIDPDTLAVRATLARMTRAARDPATAVELYAALLSLAEQVLGSEHAATLAARAGIAWCTGETGDKAGARAQFAELLPEAVQALSPVHPITLDCRAGLARWTGSVNAMQARDQFSVLLPDAVEALGPEHLETLYIRHSLARWTAQAGDPTAAVQLCVPLLSIRERNLGPDHPDTQTTRNRLKEWTDMAAGRTGPRKFHERRNVNVSELIDRVEAAKSNKDKGISLESLMSALFGQVPGFTVYESNVRTETEEIDLVVLNDGREPIYSRDAPLILVECKNWTARPGRPEFSLLEGKMRNRYGQCKIGFFVSWSGFADTTWRETIRLSRESYVIVCLIGNDVRRAALAGDFPEFLRRAYLQTLTK